MEDFQTVILDTMNPDKSKREKASNMILNLRDQYPKDLSAYLISSSSSSDLAISSQSLILYRSTLINSSIPISSYSTDSLKSSFYSLIHPSRQLSYLKKVSDILVPLSCKLHFESELFFTCSSVWLPSEHKSIQLFGLYLLETASAFNELSHIFENNSSAILSLIWTTLASPDPDIKVISCRTVCIILEQLPMSEWHLKALPALLPILQGLQSQTLIPALDGLNQLICSYPEVLDPCTDNIIKFLVSLILSPESKREIVEISGNTLIQVISGGESTVFSKPLIMQEVLSASFHLLLLVDFAQDLDLWSRSGPEIENSLLIIGKSLLCTLAQLVKENLFQVLMQVVNPLLRSSFWIHQQAGIQALGLVSEHCGESLLNGLDGFVEVALKHARDESPRLRCAALSCLGLFCTYLSPAINERFCGRVLEVIVENLACGFSDKVVVKAARCLINFCESIEEGEEGEELKFINRSLRNLLQVIDSIISDTASQTFVLIEVIECLTVVIETTGEYNDVVARILFKLDSILPVRDLDSKLKQVSLVCIAFIVELKDFHSANEVLEKMLNLKLTVSKTDLIYNKIMQVITNCIVRLQFIPSFFSSFIQELLENASASVDFELIEQINPGPDSFLLDLPGQGTSNLVFDADTMENKTWACLLLKDLIKGLKSQFLPWSSTCLETMKPLLDKKFDITFKEKSSKVITSLISIHSVPESERITFELFSIIVPLIHKNLQQNTKISHIFLKTVAKVGKILNDFSFIGLSGAQYLLTVLSEVVSVCVAKRQMIIDYEELSEYVIDEIVHNCGNIASILIKSFSSQFQEIFMSTSTNLFQLIFVEHEACAYAGLLVLNSFVKSCKSLPGPVQSQGLIEILGKICMNYEEEIRELAVQVMASVVTCLETSIISPFTPVIVEICKTLMKSEDLSKKSTQELFQAVSSKLQANLNVV